MQEKQISEMTLSELKGREKVLKKILLTYIVIIGLLVVVGILLTIQQGFSIFTVLFVPFMAIGLSSLGNYKKVQKERSTRK
jgi:ABC-type multidrug transport system fused ATPase/permease subunit